MLSRPKKKEVKKVYAYHDDSPAWWNDGYNRACNEWTNYYEQQQDRIKLVLKELQIVLTCPIAGTVTQEFKNERMLELIDGLNERISNGN